MEKRKVNKALIVTALITVLLISISIFTMTAGATDDLSDSAVKNGWVLEDGTWFYYENNAAATGWRKVKGSWYYFDNAGKMQTGWAKVNGSWYYLKSSGAMATGWLPEGGNWYFLKDSGAMATGWLKTDNKWYYLKSSGAMATGWIQDGGKNYYLKNSGAMATGWLRTDGEWYYLKDSGAMATGWAKVNNKWYYMDASGIMLTGWQDIDGSTYYLKDSGAMAANEWVPGYYWIDLDGRWTYDHRGNWHQNSKGWWFGDSSGWYARNTKMIINGKYYTFDANGYTQITENNQKLAAKGDDVLNIVYMGIDKQEKRSDVMMVLSFNKTKNTIAVVSLLRDSCVSIDGCSAPTKLGYAYKWGGTDLLFKTINNSYGTKLNKYISMEFEDVEAIVDAVGGVDIEIATAEVDILNRIAKGRGHQGEGVKPGMNTLNGIQAVTYARIRSTGGSFAEYIRAGRQHKVLDELFRKITAMSTDEQKALIPTILQNMKTNVDTDTIYDLTSMNMSKLKLYQYTIPDVNYERDLWNGWVDTPADYQSNWPLDPKVWMWQFDLNAAGNRLRGYIGD